jgi:23S rRNA (uracil1939-C5)-methyltransferase
MLKPGYSVIPAKAGIQKSEDGTLDPRVRGDDVNGTLFDLYSGVGLIGISLADSYVRVIGIEEGYEAVEHAKKNALRNEVTNAEFIEGKVENLLPELIQKAQKPLQVVVDPPRSGLKPEVVECLNGLPIEKLIYVSCHLEALKRDLEVLTREFQIVEVQPMDFFPQTQHIETLVLLEPKS